MVPSTQHLTMARSGISKNGHGAFSPASHNSQVGDLREWTWCTQPSISRQPGRGSQRRRGMSGSGRVAALVPWSLCSATVSAMALLLGALCSAE